MAKVKKCDFCASRDAAYQITALWDGKPFNPKVCGDNHCRSKAWVNGDRGEYDRLEILGSEAL